MISATDVVKKIRRSLLVLFSNYIATSAFVAAALTYYSKYGNDFYNFFTVFVLAACFSVIVVYPGKYIPTISKHENLLNKYGRVYLAEVEKAVGKHGMQRMLSTCWFGIYAGDFCDREITTHST